MKPIKKESWIVALLFKSLILYSFYNPITALIVIGTLWEILVWVVFVLVIIGVVLVCFNDEIFHLKKFTLKNFLIIRNHNPFPVGIALASDSLLFYFSIIFGDISLAILFGCLITFNISIDAIIKNRLSKLDEIG